MDEKQKLSNEDIVMHIIAEQWCDGTNNSHKKSKYKDEIMRRLELLEKLKCCGNCKHYYNNGMQTYCFLQSIPKGSNPNEVCDNWEFLWQ